MYLPLMTDEAHDWSQVYVRSTTGRCKMLICRDGIRAAPSTENKNDDDKVVPTTEFHRLVSAKNA